MMRATGMELMRAGLSVCARYHAVAAAVAVDSESVAVAVARLPSFPCTIN